MKLSEKFRLPNNTLFKTALILLAAFLVAELFFRTYTIYKYFPPVDVISHLLSGMALATGIYWIFSLTKVKRKAALAVFFTFAAGVIWEILEMLEEMVIPNPPYLLDYFFWDGFWDIAVMVIGGILILDILYILRKAGILR